MDLNTIANYAEIVGATAVIFAIGFAIMEFRQLRYQRRENASLEMIRSWQSPEYVKAIFEILQLEDHIAPERLRALSSEHERMAFQVSMTFEPLGVMAYRGTIPVDILNELMGGVVCTSWRKLDRWTEAFREFNPRAFEWYQWLAIQLEAMPNPDLGSQMSPMGTKRI